MMTELGHAALWLALSAQLTGGVLPLIGAHMRDSRLIALARPAAILSFLLTALAFAALMTAYARSDFSVLNAASNSHTLKPLIYKISGVWGNHEGSLLLWGLMLTGFGAAVAVLGRELPPRFHARALGIQALIGVGFFSFMLFTSNPFARLFPVPAEGNGLNPILQDPGLAIHPPMLYLGYVGFSVAYSFAIAALLDGEVTPLWARWVRPWTLAAWTALTAGIALGSWWAYYELGWGGFWFWDPVENASLMPWLSGTALLHSIAVVEKRETLKSWTVLLAILTFSLSLLGTFLVRSGVITSVHAFASDPARGVFILGFLAAVSGGSLALYALRGGSLAGGGLFSAVSREGALVFNNVLLVAAAGIVLTGTLAPILFDAIWHYKITVAGPFFDFAVLVVAPPLILLMAAGPLLSWRKGDAANVLLRLRAALALAVTTALLFLFLSFQPSRALIGTATGAGLGVYAIAGALTELHGRLKSAKSGAALLRRFTHLPRSVYGTILGHLGLGVICIAVSASGPFSIEKLASMAPGDHIGAGGYSLRLADVKPVIGPNYTAVEGRFEVTGKGGAPVAVLKPQSRLYMEPRQPATEAAIKSRPFGDLYAVIGEGQENGRYAVRVYVKAGIPWIWAGAAILVLAGLLSLSDRRHRTGARAARREEKLSHKEPGPP